MVQVTDMGYREVLANEGDGDVLCMPLQFLKSTMSFVVASKMAQCRNPACAYGPWHRRVTESAYRPIQRFLVPL